MSEQANELTDERVARYFSLDSWLFWPIVDVTKKADSTLETDDKTMSECRRKERGCD